MLRLHCQSAQLAFRVMLPGSRTWYCHAQDHNSPPHMTSPLVDDVTCLFLDIFATFVPFFFCFNVYLKLSDTGVFRPFHSFCRSHSRPNVLPVFYSCFDVRPDSFVCLMVYVTPVQSTRPRTFKICNYYSQGIYSCCCSAYPAMINGQQVLSCISSPAVSSSQMHGSISSVCSNLRKCALTEIYHFLCQLQVLIIVPSCVYQAACVAIT